jgi:hypothetical protein
VTDSLTFQHHMSNAFVELVDVSSAKVGILDNWKCLKVTST